MWRSRVLLPESFHYTPSAGLAKRRVPVASKDPVVAITCLCMRADALSTGEAAVAPAAPVVPAAAADLAPIGGEGGEEEDEGGGGGLGDGAVAGGSPILGADEGFDPGQNPSKILDPDCADGGGGVEAVVFTWAAGGAPGALRRAAVGGADVRRFADEAAMLAAWQSWLLRIDPDVLAIFQVRGLLAHRKRLQENAKDEGWCWQGLHESGADVRQYPSKAAPAYGGPAKTLPCWLSGKCG